MRLIVVLALTLAVPLLADGCADADFELTVDNPATGELLSAPLAFSHQEGFHLFQKSLPATDGLATLARTGVSTKLTAELRASTRVLDVQSATTQIRPGESGKVVVHVSCPATILALVAKSGDGATFTSLDFPAPLKGERLFTGARYEDGAAGVVERADGAAKAIRVHVRAVWP